MHNFYEYIWFLKYKMIFGVSMTESYIFEKDVDMKLIESLFITHDHHGGYPMF